MIDAHPRPRLTTTLRRNASRRFRSSLVAAALFAFVCGEAQASVEQETTQRIYPLGANPTLKVRNTDGRIYIYGSDDGEIRITAAKRAFTKERLDRIQVQVAIQGSEAMIDTIYPAPGGSLFADRSGTVDYTILVPQDCAVSEAELANGEILIEGIRGARLEAHLGKGRLLLRSCFSEIDASVGKGGMDVYYPWWEEMQFSLSATVLDGNLRLDLPADASLQLEATTTTGHIDNGFAAEHEQTGNGKTVNTKIGDNPNARFKLHTDGGNIRINRVK
jgi:putative adhesin